MAEHKHAAVLRAIADGKVVQWRSTSTPRDGHVWIDLTEWGSLNPVAHPWMEWRVKPEPKPDVVRWTCWHEGSTQWSEYPTKQLGYGIDQIKIVRDGTTGKLKSVEIVE